MPQLPSDIIQFLRWAQDCGFAPLDLMAADLLKKYTTQVGPSEFKDDPETVSRSDLMMERMYGKETWTSMKAHFIKINHRKQDG